MPACELHLRPGISAFIGSGGKTTLIGACAGELSRAGKKVIVCTTTHIYPFEGMPLAPARRDDPPFRIREQIEAAFAGSHCLCTGTVSSGGKLTAPPVPLRDLAGLADYILVEADGSAGLPLKAHADHEPVIPEGAGSVICVFGLGGFYRPVSESVHRPERFISRLAAGGFTSVTPGTPVTPAMAARVFEAEKTGAGTIFLNQADLPRTGVMADEFIRALTRGPYHILAGSAASGSISIRAGNGGFIVH